MEFSALFTQDLSLYTLHTEERNNSTATPLILPCMYPSSLDSPKKLNCYKAKIKEWPSTYNDLLHYDTTLCRSESRKELTTWKTFWGFVLWH